jgi:hypothetical protein
MPRGGHFAALEEPELFTRDVVTFFRGLRTTGGDLNQEKSDAFAAL